jgi:hypothetical protein
MAKPDEGSYVRWQSIRIAQFGNLANLILTFATASLGFSVTELRGLRDGSACYSTCFWLLADLALLVSVALGILCAVNRLHDFRETAKIARKREQMEEDNFARDEIDARLKGCRDANAERGERTWTLFY